MAKMFLVLAAVALVGVLAEPPVGNQYLPPGPGGYSGSLSSRYGAPSRSSRLGSGRSSSRGRLGGSRGGLSTRYGAPGASGRLGGSLSSVYGAPGFGGSNAAFSAPSSQYGVPGFGGGSIGGGSSGAFSTPSSQYGAPGFGGGSSGSFSAPSSQYGAPGFGGGSSGAFSSPSSQYGAPGFGGSNGAFSSPSRQYGAPSGNGGFGGSSSYSSGASGRLGGAPAPVYGAPFGGYRGTTEDPLAEPANYEFSYEVQDLDSGNDFGHQENRQDEAALGEYRVTLPDGRTQVVEYEANEEGYNPTIRYEETAESAAAADRSESIRNAQGYNYGRGQGSGGPY